MSNEMAINTYLSTTKSKKQNRQALSGEHPHLFSLSSMFIYLFTLNCKDPTRLATKGTMGNGSLSWACLLKLSSRPPFLWLFRANSSPVWLTFFPITFLESHSRALPSLTFCFFYPRLFRELTAAPLDSILSCNNSREPTQSTDYARSCCFSYPKPFLCSTVPSFNKHTL